MANTNNKLTIGTIAANGLILIGAGHGAAPLLMVAPLYVLRGSAYDELSFSMSGSYDSTIMACCLFSFIGVVLLFLSLFNVSRVLRIPGIASLWLGFAYLTHGLVNDNGLASFSFWTGLPFLICSVILLVRTILSLREPSAE